MYDVGLLKIISHAEHDRLRPRYLLVTYPFDWLRVRNCIQL